MICVRGTRLCLSQILSFKDPFSKIVSLNSFGEVLNKLYKKFSELHIKCCFDLRLTQSVLILGKCQNITTRTVWNILFCSINFWYRFKFLKISLYWLKKGMFIGKTSHKEVRSLLKLLFDLNQALKLNCFMLVLKV